MSIAGTCSGPLRWLPAAILWAFAATGASGAPLAAARLAAAGDEPRNWLLHGRTYDEQRHSPLSQINEDNVEALGLAWYYEYEHRRGLESTPLVHEGTLYATGNWSVVYAHDAATGELLWRFDPEVPKEWGRYACCDVVNRGVALWGDRVFVGTLDGRLLALDARDGHLLWDVVTVERARPYTITGAPRVVKGKVIIGNGGAEYGVRGYVSAYDAASGELVWRFWTVPGDPAAGHENELVARIAETWSGEWWIEGGGGTVWDSMAYDPELDLLYIGVGNGSPWNRYHRNPDGLDNLFLVSIVALRPDTGAYVWHYQLVPNEGWDYTATQHMILADITWQGEPRAVLMQAPKNGFFFVLDRETGEFLSAEPYVEVTWAHGYDADGRPIENQDLDYRDAAKMIRPSPLGGHNWQPMSYSPDTGLVYIPAQDGLLPYNHDRDYRYTPGVYNTGMIAEAAGLPVDDPAVLQSFLRRMFKGYLLAWDPVAQRPVWRVAHPLMWNGGVLSTGGGLVFQGTGDGRLVAYRATDGETLWEYPVPGGIIAPPVTYESNGRQFLVVQAGWGGGFPLPMAQKLPEGVPGRTLAFVLDGRESLPPAPAPTRFEPPARTSADDATLLAGERLYGRYCMVCHGAFAVSGTAVPDLRFMHESRHAIFNDIVRGGVLAKAGMPGFGDLLTDDDAEGIHAYIIHQANNTVEAAAAPGWWRALKSAFFEAVFATVAAFM